MTTKMSRRPRAVPQTKWSALKADPFNIPEEIVPKGMVYQWCAQSEMGQPQESLQKLWKDVGWQPVPAKRHPYLPHNKIGQIEHRGQLLMERPEEMAAAAREAEIQAAWVMQEKARSWAPSSSATRGKPQLLARYEPTVVTIPIDIRLTSREMEAAAISRITPEKYVRNKIALLLQGNAGVIEGGLPVLAATTDGKFHFGGIKITLQVPVAAAP